MPAAPARVRAQMLSRSASPRGVAGFKRDLDDRLLRAAGEEMNQVHRIAGGHDAHEIAGDFDVVCARFAV